MVLEGARPSYPPCTIMGVTWTLLCCVQTPSSVPVRMALVFAQQCHIAGLRFLKNSKFDGGGRDILFRRFHHHLPEHKQCPSQGQESSPPACRTDTKKVYCKHQLFSTQEYWNLLIWQCPKIPVQRSVEQEGLSEPLWPSPSQQKWEIGKDKGPVLLSHECHCS